MAGAVVRTASSTLAPLVHLRGKRILRATQMFYYILSFCVSRRQLCAARCVQDSNLSFNLTIHVVMRCVHASKTVRARSAPENRARCADRCWSVHLYLRPQTRRARSAPETRARRLRQTAGRRSRRASTRGSTAHSAQHSAMRRLSMRGVCFEIGRAHV